MSDDPNRTICFCHCVDFTALIQAIRDGSRTLAEIKEKTHASTGCGGCEFEVQEILAAELKALD